MKNEEIKSIKLGTILTWNPTGELFKVIGLNELKIKDGTATKVAGLECDSEGHYNSESMPSLYSLSKSNF